METKLTADRRRSAAPCSGSSESPQTFDNTMNLDQERFATNLAANTKTHDEWLLVVKFGLGTLLQNQGTLAEILAAEAARESAKNNEPPHYEMHRMMRELGLKFVC